MRLFEITIILVWFIRIAANILTYVNLWRVKEYRLDRMFIHLSTPQGKSIWSPQWKRPPITLKTIVLTFASLGVVVCGYNWLPFAWYITMPLLDIASFPLTMVLVIFMQGPTFLYHTYIIRSAVRKLRVHAPMTVIGITGSYGKTSTKDFAAEILAQKYSVLKTVTSKNSPIGIAEVIHKNLSPLHTVFVVEMGAYKLGEIAYMSTMVRPNIGVVTAINAQHQDLFGSLDTTMKAKYELIQSLSAPKLAIFNADNDRTRMMAHWAARDRCTVRYFSKDGYAQKGANTIAAGHIVASASGLSFDCVYKKTIIPIKTSVLGAHQVSNILAAIAICVACGMDFATAARGARTLTPAHGVMESVPGIGDSIFINDTFNNNPEAAKSAIEFMRLGAAKKILVFQPMIELGEFAQASHADVGAYAARYCDAILLTNANYYQDFERGVRSVSQTVPLLVFSPSATATYIREHARSGDIVLFKGKESAVSLGKLLKG